MTAQTGRDGYNATAELVFQTVRDWKGKPLVFMFPPREVAILAGVDQVDNMLADSEGARDLIALLVEQAKPGEPPTVMMLRVVLEMLDVPIKWVSISAWGARARGFMVGPL